MKRKKWVFINLAIVAVWLATVVTGAVFLSDKLPLIQPVYSESRHVIAADGTEFTVTHTENDFPDQEIWISVSCNGEVIMQDGSFDSFLSWYDYWNDIVDNWYEIIDEYHADGVHAFRFHWGVLYTVDDRATYQTVLKHTYDTVLAEDAVFRTIFSTWEP